MLSSDYSFAEAQQAAAYPAHGWALNASGNPMLWLPILRLAADAAEFRASIGKTPLTEGDEFAIVALHDVTLKLAITLRELHEATTSEITPVYVKGACATKVARTGKQLELGPLYVDLALVYLRRLADSLTTALRPLLFGKSGASPMQFAKLQELCEAPIRLSRLDPLGDVDVLVAAIQAHSGWVDRLRTITRSGGERKGIRDIREHQTSLLNTGFSVTAGGGYRMSALMAMSSKYPPIGDLLEVLRQLCADLCAMLTGIHRSVRPDGRYFAWEAPAGDCLRITGDRVHATGFWPRISA